jgi:hypothetical protein
MQHRLTPASAFIALLIMASSTSAQNGTGAWTAFRDLPSGPASNRALACSGPECPPIRAFRGSIAFDAPVEAIAAAVERLERGVLRRPEAGGLRLRYVAVTPMLRFRDDVDLLILPDGEERSRVAVYSRSRIGLSDLGTNRRRVEALERRLRAELALGGAPA